MRIGTIAVACAAVAGCVVVACTAFVDRVGASHDALVASLEAEIGTPVHVEGIVDGRIATSDTRDVYVSGRDASGRLVLERYSRSEVGIGAPGEPAPGTD